jgi:5,10-methylenetetrahydrofolate reductase
VVLARSLEVIDALEPSFVSVTYRGGSASRQRTYDLVTEIQSDGSRHRDGAPHLRGSSSRRDA